MGLERDALLDVLADSPIGPSVRTKRASVESCHYPPRFKLGLAAKDMRLVVEAADAAGLDLIGARAARGWLDEAARQGASDLDYSAVVAIIAGDPARA